MTDNQKIVNNITKAILTDNVNCLTYKSLCFLSNLDNFKPDDLFGLGWYNKTRRSEKEQVQKWLVYLGNKNLFDFIVSDYNLNYSLTWIVHWNKTRGENNPEVIEEFRRKCWIVNEIRKLLKVKRFGVKYIYSPYSWLPRKAQFKKCYEAVYAIDMKQALSIFRKNHNGVNKEFKIKRVRQTGQDALYMINSAQTGTELFQKLT